MLAAYALMLLIGLALLAYFSNKAVEHAADIAYKLGISSLIVGVLIVSLGTDLPEISNSIISSYSGHGDINVGDSLGSSLSQVSLAFGIIVMLGGTVKADRRNILVLGACTIAAAIAALLVLMDGELSRPDALFLIFTYILLLAISARFTVKKYRHPEEVVPVERRIKVEVAAAYLVISLVFVAVGAMIVVDSIINISKEYALPEYFISFFTLGIGTSLPEISVELAALRKKRYGIVLGDMMGSNITDATFAMGIGPLLFPVGVSAALILPLALYTIAAIAIIVALFAWREQITRFDAAILIAIYLLSIVFAGSYML